MAPEALHGFPAFAPEIALGTSWYDPGLYAELDRAERDHFWFSARQRLILWALQRYFPFAQSLLEIGCGCGNVLAAIAAARPAMRIVGSETLLEGLERARKRLPGSISLFQMDARRLPYVEEFDIIGAFDVLEHIVEDETVLMEMHRSCRRGGGIILTVPQHPWLWSGADETAHHVRRYRAGELRKKVEAAGFALIRSTSFMSLVLPLMLAGRLGRRKADYDFRDELILLPFVNRALSALAALDYYFIRAGLNFPLGGSLLVIARKVET
jgi:SAM-dependent methyltransferase